MKFITSVLVGLAAFLVIWALGSFGVWVDSKFTMRTALFYSVYRWLIPTIAIVAGGYVGFMHFEEWIDARGE